jgi:hypothetical protein
MTDITKGVYGFSQHVEGYERVELEDLQMLQGHYFLGPATIRLTVHGKHSTAAVDLTPEAVAELIAVLQKAI